MVCCGLFLRRTPRASTRSGRDCGHVLEFKVRTMVRTSKPLTVTKFTTLQLRILVFRVTPKGASRLKPWNASHNRLAGHERNIRGATSRVKPCPRTNTRVPTVRHRPRCVDGLGSRVGSHHSPLRRVNTWMTFGRTAAGGPAWPLMLNLGMKVLEVGCGPGSRKPSGTWS